MLSNAYFLAKFRFDPAENEPAKNLQNFANFANKKAQRPFSQVRAAVPPAAGGAAAAAAALPRAPPPALPHRADILRQGPSSAFEITRSERKSQFGIQEQSHRSISPGRERQTTPLGIFR